MNAPQEALIYVASDERLVAAGTVLEAKRRERPKDGPAGARSRRLRVNTGVYTAVNEDVDRARVRVPPVARISSAAINQGFPTGAARSLMYPSHGTDPSHCIGANR
ncbi:hypothetical protein GCM10009016_01710 [Halomonas beimenensis]